MKKLVALPMILALSGCAIHTAPVTATFPEAPATLQERCAVLQEATEDMTLSQYTKTVVDNYMLYHECSRKVEGWNEWYIRQREIFEAATKK
jgi:hypothetical protein